MRVYPIWITCCNIVNGYNVPHKLDSEIRCEISLRKYYNSTAKEMIYGNNEEEI